MIKEKQVRVHSLKNPLGTLKMMPTAEYLKSVRDGNYKHSKISEDRIALRKRIWTNYLLIAKDEQPIYFKPRFGGYKIPMI